MEVKFKYSVGDTVTLAKLPTSDNLQFVNKFMWDTEFKPKDYKIEQCKFVITETGEKLVYYNLYAYCDEIIQFNNWIPESYLEGKANEHVEQVEFVSHDNETLNIGDDVLCSAFYGDYNKPYLPPDFTFTYVGTIVRLVFTINERTSSPIKSAVVQSSFPDNMMDNEFTPYLVKNFDKNFVKEYVASCKKNRFNPEKEVHAYSKHDKIFKYIKLWDDVIEVYKNWDKEKKKKSTKPTAKKNKKETIKEYFEKLLETLSEEEKNELKKQLSNE